MKFDASMARNWAVRTTCEKGLRYALKILAGNNMIQYLSDRGLNSGGILLKRITAEDFRDRRVGMKDGAMTRRINCHLAHSTPLHGILVSWSQCLHVPQAVVSMRTGFEPTPDQKPPIQLRWGMTPVCDEKTMEGWNGSLVPENQFSPILATEVTVIASLGWPWSSVSQ